MPWNGNNASAVISRTGQRPGVGREAAPEGVLNSLLAPTMPTLNLPLPSPSRSRQGGGEEEAYEGKVAPCSGGIHLGNKATELTFRSHGDSTPVHLRVEDKEEGGGESLLWSSSLSELPHIDPPTYNSTPAPLILKRGGVRKSCTGLHKSRFARGVKSVFWPVSLVGWGRKDRFIGPLLLGS